jgi:hypothetical protein
MKAKVWISPRKVGSLEKPKKAGYEGTLDSSKLYGYEMSEAGALTVGGLCLTVDAIIVAAFLT